MAFVLASALAAAAPAHADPPAWARLRSAVAARRAQRVVWRAALRESAEHVGGWTVLHQVREARHRALWREALAVRPRAREVLRRWIASGRYPGLWTLPGVEPWYHVDVAGPAVRIRLRDDAILFDHDIPEHRAVYEAWLENERALRGPEPPNRFDLLRDDDGVPFSLRAQVVGGPAFERFYREMRIAGVPYYDPFGRECIVLLDAGAVAEVAFPDEQP